jgi:hypothetical protein
MTEAVPNGQFHAGDNRDTITVRTMPPRPFKPHHLASLCTYQLPWKSLRECMKSAFAGDILRELWHVCRCLATLCTSC